MATAHAVCMLTTARAGSGKTYLRCARFLVDEFLPERDGDHWSNFPLYPSRIATAVAARKKDSSASDIEARMKIIPPEVLSSWEMGRSGPWDFFRDIDVNGAHIAIDEIHKYCARNSSKELKKKWQVWCGEIRHRGATVEFISQHYRKIAQEIIDESGIRLQLINSEDRRDWFFRILMGDWYELRASWITRCYETRVWVYEKRETDGRWHDEDKRTFTLDPQYFEFYDSYSAPEKGGHKGQAVLRQFERLSRAALTFWFFKRNWFRLGRGLGFVFLIAWLCTGGGRTAMGWWLHVFTGKMLAAMSTSSRVAASGNAASINENISATDISTSPATGPATQTAMVPYSELLKEREISHEYQQKFQELSNRFDRMGEVVLLEPGSVTFRSGFTYHVGEKIQWGPFAGRSIASINLAKGTVHFDDGSSLGLGSRELLHAATQPSVGK